MGRSNLREFLKLDFGFARSPHSRLRWLMCTPHSVRPSAACSLYFVAAGGTAAGVLEGGKACNRSGTYKLTVGPNPWARELALNLNYGDGALPVYSLPDPITRGAIVCSFLSRYHPPASAFESSSGSSSTEIQSLKFESECRLISPFLFRPGTQHATHCMSTRHL